VSHVAGYRHDLREQTELVSGALERRRLASGYYQAHPALRVQTRYLQAEAP
jgi:hypothetical protein